MAITKVTEVAWLEVKPAIDSSAASTANDAHPSVRIEYKDTIDDDSDSDLPVFNFRFETLFKYVEDGGSATDVSGKDALVRTVCQAIWS